MNVTLPPSAPHGTLRAIASKSVAHRLLICAAFADAPTRIRCEQTNEDIDATAACLVALGATITREPPFYTVSPIRELPREVTLPCRESGSTLRFLVPIVASLGISARFEMAGRLPSRPLSPLREELEAHGITFSAVGSNPLCMSGILTGHTFTIPGNVSSQFVSGLLFALALCGNGGTLSIQGSLESAPYVAMTCDALDRFQANIEKQKNGFAVIPSAIRTPNESLAVEGDWSNAAFPLAAAAIGGEVTVTGLDRHSRQGDRVIVDLLRSFGAQVTETDDSVTVRHAPLHGIRVDATQIPDLVPVLATVASVAEGETVIVGASRLRIKESDRLATVCEMLTRLGAKITETSDGLILRGVPALSGGIVSASGDHRIAMSAAVASVACTAPVTVTGAEATAKSYPAFFDDMSLLGFAISTFNC